MAVARKTGKTRRLLYSCIRSAICTIGRTRRAACAAKATETSRGCFCSHASNSSLLFILASGPSRHQRPFAAFSAWPRCRDSASHADWPVMKATTIAPFVTPGLIGHPPRAFSACRALASLPRVGNGPWRKWSCRLLRFTRRRRAADGKLYLPH
jgi:hypothetical protein